MNNKNSLVSIINDVKDIKKINDKTIYININCKNINDEVIKYFIDNGQNYYYSDNVNNSGYIYVDYNTFVKANEIINNIINKMPSDLNKLQITKYLYIQIAKNISYDINALDNKNENNSNYHYLYTSNIWGSLKSKKGTNISYVKLFYYLCKIFDIENEIICLNNNNYLGNKITIKESDKTITFLTDITKDVPFIQAGFKTKHFGDYNIDSNLDKKIKYITNNYNEEILDLNLKQENNEDIYKILLNSQKIINLYNMGQVEMGIIYDVIFHKYKSMHNININNLYIKNKKEKIHFILITEEDKHYSYNYKKKTFVEIDYEQLKENIENGNIGIYLNEIIPNINDEQNILKYT